jgi:phosphatidylinositol alpha-1,6-mannosyltransferase
MRLLLIASEFPPGPGGIGTHAYQIALNLARRGWEVAVVTRQDYASAEEINEFNQAQPFLIFPFKRARPAGLYRFAALCYWLKNWPADAILASGENALWLSALATRFYRLPWVIVGHGAEFGTPVTWKRYLNQWALSRADCTICVSEYTRHKMLTSGFKPHYHQVIPNGADEHTFRPINGKRIADFRSLLGLKGKTLILSVGQVIERKGHDIVIQALPAILEEIANVHYLVVGIPTRQRELTKLAQTLGVAERVHFLGRVDSQRLVEAYNACDVYVMTSRHCRDGDFEGYGIAAVEAALCGKPAVVCDNSGLVEAIVPGKTGIVVPENNPEATTLALMRLLNDPPLRRRLGQRAREHALKNQTWGMRVAEYEKVLNTVIEKR